MTKCFTFYSYKGGSGRTTAAINTTHHLIKEYNASKNNPILLVDADLESAGLTFFFNLEKKFTDKFDSSIHTTKIFTSATDALSGQSGDQLFEIHPNSEAFIANNNSLIAKLSAIFPDVDIKSALNGIKLCHSEADILKNIAEVTASTSPALASKREYIKKFHNLTSIIYQLVRHELSKNELDSDKVDMEKTKLVRDFLPAVSFVDVSSFFGAEEGTVKFLGADVHYQGAQVLKGENIVDAIEDLRYLCNDKNYSAIVFDSGAGSQSSADAFHRLSDIIVYCMRPTKQFRQGTASNLANYQRTLELTKSEKELDEDAKLIILLPTAVPNSESAKAKAENAFHDIRASILNAYPQLIDGTFCTFDTALNEVESFKWEERILTEETVKGIPDEEKAYGVYKALASKMIELTK